MGVFALKPHLFKHRRLGWLQEAVQAAQDKHRQDYIAIFSTDKHVSQTIIGNGPTEIDNLIMCGVIHVLLILL